MASDFPKKGRLKQIYVQDEKVRLKKLVCPWCSDIFHEPQRLFCGHTLCNQCLQDELECAKSKNGFMKCIICRQIVDQEQIGEDRIAQGIVDQIRVKCPAKKCTWEGFNKDFLQHYDHQCAQGQRACEARYEIKYFSKKAEFMRKLNDDEEIKDEKPNMLHPSMKTSLREKLEKEWEVQMKYKDEEFLRQTKRLRKTFGL